MPKIGCDCRRLREGCAWNNYSSRSQERTIQGPPFKTEVFNPKYYFLLEWKESSKLEIIGFWPISLLFKMTLSHYGIPCYTMNLETQQSTLVASLRLRSNIVIHVNPPIEGKLGAFFHRQGLVIKPWVNLHWIRIEHTWPKNSASTLWFHSYI